MPLYGCRLWFVDLHMFLICYAIYKRKDHEQWHFLFYLQEADLHLLHIIFERKYLISVQCIVLLERLSVTRQQPAAGWQQWSDWHHMAVPGNMHGQTLHRYPGRHWDTETLLSCYLRLTTDMGADKQIFNKTRSFWPVMRAWNLS